MGVTIACGHCRGTHGSVAEVRACSLGSEPGTKRREEVPSPEVEQPTATGPPRRAGSTSRSPSRRFAPEALADRPELGRGLVIGTNDPIPAPWAGCPVVVTGPDADRACTDRLHRAWRQRERLVVRWSGPERSPGELAGPAVLDGPFHRLEPGDEPAGERLRFALTANMVWAVDGLVAFEPLDRAVEIAGAPVSELAVDQGGRVRLGDGSWAAVDGGPLDLHLEEPVVPRVHLTSGLLRPLRPTPAEPPSTIGLAPDQLAAVTHRTGPARILAPAGSGKTRVLTERTRYLVETAGVAARIATLVAYNRRARQEMADRLGPRSGRDLGPVTIRTLNSLALAITTGRDGFAAPPRGVAPVTITEPEVRRILGRLVPGRRRRQLTDPLEPWIDALAACRLGLRDPDEVADAYGGDIDGFPEILGRYRHELERRNQVDFDEQVVRAVERLATEPQTRDTARQVAPLLLIDEFQDLTPAHLLLIRLVAGPAAEVFAVGDDDQTIYGYSGASPRWLVHFNRFFPGAVDHPLTVNYRCPEPVVQAAGSLLSHNRFRVAKTVTAGDRPPTAATTTNRRAGDRAGSTGLTIHHSGDAQENLVAHVSALLAGRSRTDGTDQVEPTDIAVLARVNAALLPAALFLEEAGIPTVRPPGLDGTILDRSGASAALAWLRLASGPARGFEPDDLRLVLRRPPRSLHPRIVDWVCEQESVAQLERLAQRLNTERDAQSVQGLADDIASTRSLADSSTTTEQLLSFIYEQIGLLGAAGQLDGSQRSARRAAHSDDLAALLAVARLQPDPGAFEPWLRQRLDRPPITAPGDGGEATGGCGTQGSDADRPAAVTLATIHTTKGLEWPHVVVHDCRDGLYPHRLADDVEEERRIFHVGITRGIASVAVTVAGPPSPFVAELAQPRTEPWPAEPVAAGGPAGSRRRPGGNGPAAGAGGRRPAADHNDERTQPETDAEAERRRALTEWRSRRAKADAVPAYIVMNNRTLDAIARHAPSTLAGLAALPGIGPAKLEAYGDEILGIVS